MASRLCASAASRFFVASVLAIRSCCSKASVALVASLYALLIRLSRVVSTLSKLVRSRLSRAASNVSRLLAESVCNCRSCAPIAEDASNASVPCLRASCSSSDFMLDVSALCFWSASKASIPCLRASCSSNGFMADVSAVRETIWFLTWSRHSNAVSVTFRSHSSTLCSHSPSRLSNSSRCRATPPFDLGVPERQDVNSSWNLI
mmetsp:Transcript_28962/g.46671  ORF Transcript_28962/g.46671 Transcript_28962/m.46671 type:complete len:204 (-) Transcript_28962:207-818(-)